MNKIDFIGSEANPLPLSGKLILVTGSAKRIGRAIATRLAALGAQIAVHYRSSKDEAHQLAHLLGNESFAVRAELGEPSQIERMFSEIEAHTKQGKIHALINNASAFHRTPFLSLSQKEWQDMMDINVTAPMLCIQQALSKGVESVVNLVDIAAWQSWKEFSAYAVSKAALLHLTKVLAKELAPTVRLNAVAPGTIFSPDDFNPAEKERLLARIPMGRMGSADEVARVVEFLLLSPTLTGVCLPVDGGQGLR